MKKHYILFGLFSLILILAIVYLYLDYKPCGCAGKSPIEGFDVKDNFTKKTATFINKNITLSTEQPKRITNGIITAGHYRLNNNEEMKLPDNYTTVTIAPEDPSKLPPSHYIALFGENPVVAKLPDNYDRVTSSPYKTQENTFPFVLPSGYYTTYLTNEHVVAKLPDYSVVLTLLPKENGIEKIPEGYYIADYNGERVLAKLPNNDMLTLPPFDQTVIPVGYYIAQYKAITQQMTPEEENDIQPKDKLAKLPYGYKLNYVLSPKRDANGNILRDANGNEIKELQRNANGNFTYKVEDMVISVTNPNDPSQTITIRYSAKRPIPETYATKQKEAESMRKDVNDYFGKVIVDRVYEKDYLRTNYDASNYNVDYHKPAEDIIKDINESALAGSSPAFGSMTVVGPDGKMIEVPYVNGQALPTYYQPGSYTYGTTYVPNYEDSVYLSRTTGLSTLGKMYPTASVLGGFCNTKTSAEELEKKCNDVSPDQCASMSCCVLLGGNKCVYGNELGPKLKANYTDKFIKNKDVYYYQGKCYGNCV